MEDVQKIKKSDINIKNAISLASKIQVIDETLALKMDLEEEMIKLRHPSECAESFVKVRSRQFKKKFTKQRDAKAKRLCGDNLKQFQTPNPFNLLEDIDDDCVQEIK